MSLENVERVRVGFEHFLATGEFLEPDPDFVWDMSHFRGWPERQVYLGTNGAVSFFRDWSAAWEQLVLEIEALHDAGDRVVAVVRQRARSKVTGVPVEMVFAQVWSMHDGHAERMEMYADAAEAFKAVGLEE